MASIRIMNPMSTPGAIDCTSSGNNNNNDNDNNNTSETEPNEPIPTPEMALFPGIVIQTGPTNNNKSSNPIISPPIPLPIPLNNIPDFSISHPKPIMETPPASTFIPQEPKTFSGSSMVHFKKALIYSSTNRNQIESPKPKLIINPEPTNIISNIPESPSHGNNDSGLSDNEYQQSEGSKNRNLDESVKSDIEYPPSDKDNGILDCQSDDGSSTTSSVNPIVNATLFSLPSTSTGAGAFTSFPSMPQVVTHVGRKPLNGPPCSLKTLVDDGILDPLDGSLTYEIPGAKFFGDLLVNGFIRMSGTNQVFANPSSWANYCRSTIPSTSKDHKNYGSAWSIIRYLGKRLDSYKLRWYRKQKKQFSMGNGSPIGPVSTGSSSIDSSSNSNNVCSSSVGGVRLFNNCPPFNTSATCKSNRNGNCTNNGSTSFLPNNLIGNDVGMSMVPGIGSPQLVANPYNNSNMNFNENNKYGNYLGVQYNNHFSTPIHLSRANVEYKNLYSMINRDRLYKLDKISAGDPEINSENFPANENLINFNSLDLNNKDLNLDDRTKVSCIPFNNVYCLQPFIVTITTNVLLLIDFHSHLLSNEVNGYLAGTWDPRTQHLTITQAYPLKYKNQKEAEANTLKIKQSIVQKNLMLLGWYHSHPHSTPHPSIKDIKRQLKYQKQMLMGKKGLRDYSPCVGLICSPFYHNCPDAEESTSTGIGTPCRRLNTLFQMFWVMPIFTMGNRNIGRPMQISYNISRDAFLTQDLLVEMRILAAYFANSSKFMKFHNRFHGELTYWDKLQESLSAKLPRDLVETQSQAVQNDIQQQALVHFWSFLKNLVLPS